MEEILHHLIGSSSHCLQGFLIPGGAGFLPSVCLEILGKRKINNAPTKIFEAKCWTWYPWLNQHIWSWHRLAMEIDADMDMTRVVMVRYFSEQAPSFIHLGPRWWFQPTSRICSSNWMIFPQSSKSKKTWNHHLVICEMKENKFLKSCDVIKVPLDVVNLFWPAWGFQGA